MGHDGRISGQELAQLKLAEERRKMEERGDWSAWIYGAVVIGGTLAWLLF